MGSSDGGLGLYSIYCMHDSNSKNGRDLRSDNMLREFTPWLQPYQGLKKEYPSLHAILPIHLDTIRDRLEAPILGP